MRNGIVILNGKRVVLRSLTGQHMLATGKCPVCGTWNSVVLDNPSPTGHPVPTCCGTEVPITYSEVSLDGQIVQKTSVRDSAEGALSWDDEVRQVIMKDPSMWCVIVLQDLIQHEDRSGHAKLPLSGHRVLDRMIGAASQKREQFVAKSLHMLWDIDGESDKAATEILRLPESIYEYIRSNQIGEIHATRLFTLHRCMVRAAADTHLTVALTDEGEVLRCRGIGLYAADTLADIRRRAFIWDFFGFMGSMLSRDDIISMTGRTSGLNFTHVPGYQGQESLQERCRPVASKMPSWEDGSLWLCSNPLPKMNSAIIRKSGTYLAGYFWHMQGVQIPFWVNVKSGLGFSMWQINREYSPDHDPLLESVVRMVAEGQATKL